MGNQQKKLKLVVIYWLPVILWMAVIFSFSSQSYEQQDLRPWLKEKIPEDTVKKYFSDVKIIYDGSEVSIRTKGVPGFIEFFIRKGGHVVEYALLGFLMLRALLATTPWRVWLAVAIAFIGSVLYAGTDELHQMYTGGRTPKLADVIIDSFGVLIGIAIFLLFYRIISRKMSKR